MPDNAQNIVIYLMFLNGLLTLGLNFIARVIARPCPQPSKERGYLLITAVLAAICAQQEQQALAAVGFAPGKAAKILLLGFIIPIFLASLVYYRAANNRNPDPLGPAAPRR